MSRHRNVRHLIAEDDYGDDDYYDDYYDDYEGSGNSAPKQTPKKQAPKATAKQLKKEAEEKKKKQQEAAEKNRLKQKQDAEKKRQQQPSVVSPPPGVSKKAAPIQSPVRSTMTPPRSNSPIIEGSASPEPPAFLKDSKPSLTLVVLGHVDAGKSTVTGSLLYQTQKDVYGGRRAPENLAWLLDEDEEERAHGVTMDIATKTLQTPKFNFILQDAPGHADYVPNMITGTVSADAALLVVDATNPSLIEASSKGQLREHCLVAKGLGVSQLIIAINKLDVLAWDQAAYESIRKSLWKFLTSIGYATTKLTVIPLSGLQGANVFDAKLPQPLKAWYSGPTLFQALDALDAPSNKTGKPLRLTVTDVTGEQGKGVGVRAKVVTGWLKVGEQLVVMPIGDKTSAHKLSSLQQYDDINRNDYAVAGQVADLVLNNIDVARISIGSLLCRPQYRPRLSKKCTAKVWLMDIQIPLIRGAQLLLYLQHLQVPCHLSRLTATLGKDGSTVVKQRPRALTSTSQALVELTLSSPIAMESFAECRALGRFVLRRSGESVAVGQIEHVL